MTFLPIASPSRIWQRCIPHLHYIRKSDNYQHKTTAISTSKNTPVFSAKTLHETHACIKKALRLRRNAFYLFCSLRVSSDYSVTFFFMLTTTTPAASARTAIVAIGATSAVFAAEAEPEPEPLPLLVELLEPEPVLPEPLLPVPAPLLPPLLPVLLPLLPLPLLLSPPLPVPPAFSVGAAVGSSVGAAVGSSVGSGVGSGVGSAFTRVTESPLHSTVTGS